MLSLRTKPVLTKGCFLKCDGTVARCCRPKTFFFSQTKEDASRCSLEIDFLIRRERKISPLEAKSGDYKRHTSLDLFSEKYRRQLGTKFVVYTKDWKKEGDVVYLPIYMTGLI